ncbi:PRC-barrel domain-containing protein [Roseobacteraceae bacterium NS-SX3]
MKKLLLSTAIALAPASALYAETDGAMFRTEADPMTVHASDFMGMRVYRAEADAEEAEEYEGVQAEWDDIGEINDVILSRDGTVEAVLVDIGGFLGIGENQVAVDMGSIRFVSDSSTTEDESDFFLVMNASADSLKDAPAYERMAAADMKEGEDAMKTEAEAKAAEAAAETEAAAESAENAAEKAGENMEAAAENAGEEMEKAAEEAGEAAENAAEETAAAAEDAADATAETAENAAEAAAAGAREPIMREGYIAAEETDLTAERLTGAPLYDGNDEWIGEVSEIILSDDGKVNSVVVDVGGFLGIGEKPVELQLGDIDILRADGGDEIRVHVAMTKDELEAMPDYEG